MNEFYGKINYETYFIVVRKFIYAISIDFNADFRRLGKARIKKLL